MYNKTEYLSQHKTADLPMGAKYLICFIFGVPSNILVLFFFAKRRLKPPDLTNNLYILTALQDTIISLLSLNHGMTLLRYRDVWLPEFCSTHHILFQMSQRMSVFLVAALSGSRTYTLVYPLRRIPPKRVLQVLATMWILMTCFFGLQFHR